MKWSTLIFFLLAITLIIGAAFLYIWLLNQYVSTKWQETGVFGDTFGGLTMFFSALAFAGVIYSLREQDKHTRIDRFESKFFQMLQAQRELVSGMDLVRTVRKKNSPERILITQGREFFKIIYTQHFTNFIFAYYKEHHGTITPERIKNKDTYRLCSLNGLLQIYERKLFPKFQNDLSHYFRHLYQIVKMLDGAKFINDKSEYIGILRSQMSTYELLLLFYNGLSENGKEYFKPLIEKYSLLKSMNAGYLMNGTDDMEDSESKYAPAAFGLKQKSRKMPEPIHKRFKIHST